MLAETLRRDRRGRAWQPMTADSGDKFDDEILTSFADDPSKQCQFSIHNLCRAGLNHDKYPGECVGPQIACLLLRDVMPSSKMQVRRLATLRELLETRHERLETRHSLATGAFWRLLARK